MRGVRERGWRLIELGLAVVAVLAAVYFQNPWLAVILVLLPVLWILGGFIARRVLLGRMFGSATLVATESVVRGQPVDLELQVTPRRTVRPDAVEWELVGEETAILRGGRSNTTYTEAFARVGDAVRQPEPWRQGQPVTLCSRLVVPPAAPPSYSRANHSLLWWAVARVKVSGSPTLTLRQQVEVHLPEAPLVEWDGPPATLVVEQSGLRGELTLQVPDEGETPIVQPGGLLVGKLAL